MDVPGTFPGAAGGRAPKSRGEDLRSSKESLVATNRFPAPCSVCGANVPARGGQLDKVGGAWQVTHLACKEGAPSVMSVSFGGKSFIRNTRGRCEDAPCCGCCTC